MFPDIEQLLFGGSMLVIDLRAAIEAGVDKVLAERERSALIKGVAAGRAASDIYTSIKLGR